MAPADALNDDTQFAATIRVSGSFIHLAIQSSQLMINLMATLTAMETMAIHLRLWHRLHQWGSIGDHGNSCANGHPLAIMAQMATMNNGADGDNANGCSIGATQRRQRR